MTASSFSIGMKRVRFAKTEDYEVNYLGADEEGDAERSYLADDFAERKEGRRLEAEECKAKGYGIFIMDSFEDPAARVQAHINIFTQLPDPFCGRGLERHVSTKHDWERREWRYKCVQNVLAEESRLRYLGGWHEEDLLWEQIANVSMQASRRAKLFARRLGKADEYVVQHGELEDLEETSHLVDQAKALQKKRSLQNIMCPASPVRCRSAGTSGSTACPMSADMLSQSMNSHCSRRRSTPAISVSFCTPDRNLPPLDFDRTSNPFDDDISKPSARKKNRKEKQKAGSINGTSNPFDDDISKPSARKKKNNKKEKQKAGSINNSTPKKFVTRWSSFKKLASMEQRGEDTLPHIPTTSPFLSQPEQHECSPSSKSTSLPTWSSMESGEDEESLMSGATTDFDDSMVFNRRRTRRGRASHPTLATLEEGDQSWNDSSSKHDSASVRDRSSSSFFGNWSGQRRKGEENNANEDLQDSQVSLKLEHLGLASDDNDDSGDDDTTENSFRARRRSDDLPKRPPTTLWRKSMSSISPGKEGRLSFGRPPPTAHTKRSQLLKAERWASSRFAQSTSALGAVDELKQQTDEEQSIASSPLFTSRPTRGSSFQGMSQWKSASALNYSAAPEHEDSNASVSVTAKSSKSKRNLRKFLKRLSSSSKVAGGEERPRHHEDKPHKQGSRAMLTRWGSSSVLVGRKHDAPVVQSSRHSDVSVVETPLLEFDLGEMGLLQQPSRRGGLLITGHSSSPALLLDRRVPHKTFSNSTLDSNSTTVSTRSTGIGPTREHKLKQNLVCRLMSRGNLLQGHASKRFLDSGGHSLG